MSVVAVLDATPLLGDELRQGLERRVARWQELRFLTTYVAAEGTLTEFDGGADLVKAYTPQLVADVDLLLICGDPGRVLDDLPASSRAIVLDLLRPSRLGTPVVPGVNPEQTSGARVVVSPHPAVIALAHLLAPLRPLGLEDAVASIIQPASMREKAGMEELLEQTRSILSFRQERPEAVFGRQLAFNLLPVAAPAEHLVSQLGHVLGDEPPVALHLLQGGVFHGLAVSLFVRFAGDPGASEIVKRLERSPALGSPEDREHLGPIDAAGREEILLGGVEAAPGRPGAYWLWAMLDNLTRGGALNCLEIADLMFGDPASDG